MPALWCRLAQRVAGQGEQCRRNLIHATQIALIIVNRVNGVSRGIDDRHRNRNRRVGWVAFPQRGSPIGGAAEIVPFSDSSMKHAATWHAEIACAICAHHLPL